MGIHQVVFPKGQPVGHAARVLAHEFLPARVELGQGPRPAEVQFHGSLQGQAREVIVYPIAQHIGGDAGVGQVHQQATAGALQHLGHEIRLADPQMRQVGEEGDVLQDQGHAQALGQGRSVARDAAQRLLALQQGRGGLGDQRAIQVHIGDAEADVLRSPGRAAEPHPALQALDHRGIRRRVVGEGIIQMQ